MKPTERTTRRKGIHRLRKIRRWLKYKYLLLLRAKGGPAKVARGFSIGLAIEMITLPTFGLAFLLIFPLVKLMRANLAGSLIGFVLGKVIAVPMLFLSKKVGSFVLPKPYYRLMHDALPDWLDHAIKISFKVIVGGTIVGTILGVIVYFPLKYLLEFYAAKRVDKRKRRKAQIVSLKNGNNKRH